MSKIEYSYNGLTTYGAADIWCIEAYLDYDFKGNALKHLIENEGFSISEKKNMLGTYDLIARDGTRVAQLVPDTDNL